MRLDKDGVLSILLGIVLILAMWGVEFYFTHSWSTAIVMLVKDIIVGGIAAVGILLIIVGILFILAW